MKASTLAATFAILGASYVAASEEGGGVQIVALSQNLTATGGTGQVSAAGSLEPFGGIGLGCGINWEENSSFGGGLQAGTSTFGLGGGFTTTNETMSVGIGIGVTSIFNSSVQLDVTTEGSVSFVFSASSAFTCENTVVDGQNAIKCSSA